MMPNQSVQPTIMAEARTAPAMIVGSLLMSVKRTKFFSGKGVSS